MLDERMTSFAKKPMAVAAGAPSPALLERARALLNEQRALLAARVDRSFALLLLVQYAACIVAALFVAAHRFGVSSPDGRALVLAAVLFGALFTAPSVALALIRPGETLTRHVVAAGQMLMSGLFIYISGGRVETHFHVFGSLAFLAFYRDWRVLITASVIVALDHAIRGAFWPMTIYGTPVVDHWRWLEHAGWVVFEVTFLTLSIRQSREMLMNIATRRAELEQTRDTALLASRAKDDFMAVLSHELRTPLTPSLMTLNALAEDERLDEETREELDRVRRNVELEARLIDDLLDVTRITSGKLQLSPGHVDLHSLLVHILDTCRTEFQQKQITVTQRFEATRHWNYGDSARLQQVFWNLIRNAVKFTPAGGRIEVTTKDAGDRIRIDITDSGIGITEDVLPKIFERFEQGGAGTTRQFGGLGLGLSICRAIVELHRGAIRAESRGRGWGSTFTVVLPAQPAAPAPKPTSQTQMLRLSGVLPRRVLLVDDHPDTRETLAKLLIRAGYEVTSADGVRSALDKATKTKFDILVSDLGLPDGHGTDLMRELKTRYQLPGVAFSGFGMQEDVQRSHEAGFSAHLTKPVDFKQLKEAMGQALSNNLRAAAAAAANQ